MEDVYIRLDKEHSISLEEFDRRIEQKLTELSEKELKSKKKKKKEDDENNGSETNT